MKINTRTVWQMTDSGEYILLEQDSHEYVGPVAECFGGRSRTTSNTSQTIDTTNVGLQDIEGIGVAGGGDVEVNLQQTDHGAIEAGMSVANRSFDFAGEFGSEAFDFGSDAIAQSAQVANAAIATSQKALATVATGGASDIVNAQSRTAVIVALAAVAAFILYTISRS